MPLEMRTPLVVIYIRCLITTALMTPMAIGFMGTYYVVRGDDEGSVCKSGNVDGCISDD